MRLDRFLIRRGTHSSKQVAQLIADGRVHIGGLVEIDHRQKIDRFSEISLDGELLQSQAAIYLMLHKPAGYLSATQDPQHPTVLELIDSSLRPGLHLAGRLDRATTGLLLLTNDGRWSKRITEPLEKIPKVYHLTTRDAISPETADRFAAGIHFAYENLITLPAVLEVITPREARLTLHEGRYHQVKRMFHAVGNQVLTLHRESIGPLVLDDCLPSGKFRHLTAGEVAHFF
jgi:16S rRNA pseudouridine516 synthase